MLRGVCRGVSTNDCVQGQRTLPENLFVARHSRTLLTSLLVQIGKHHVDLRKKKNKNYSLTKKKRLTF